MGLTAYVSVIQILRKGGVVLLFTLVFFGVLFNQGHRKVYIIFLNLSLNCKISEGGIYIGYVCL